jgi:hypothetical protein
VSQLVAQYGYLNRPVLAYTRCVTYLSLYKTGAALRVRHPRCQPRNQLLRGPPHPEVEPLLALIASNSRSDALSDTRCRAASTLITVAAGTRAGAATRARDPGSQPRHRPAAARAENCASPNCTRFSTLRAI